MRALIGAAIAVACGTFVVQAGQEPPTQVERPFKPGGSIGLDLSAGAYTIRGTADEVIRVRWDVRDPADRSRVRTDVAVAGASATIRTRGPKNNFRVDIDVPGRCDLDLTLSAGDVRIRGIEGNKSLSMWAGDVTIEVGRAELYRQIDASVRAGDLTIEPFNRNTGGLLRSFHWTGSGKYAIRARLFAGDLKLVR
jgi:hypothetical protein